jgi:hypothetical protein
MQATPRGEYLLFMISFLSGSFGLSAAAVLTPLVHMAPGLRLIDDFEEWFRRTAGLRVRTVPARRKHPALYRHLPEDLGSLQRI